MWSSITRLHKQHYGQQLICHLEPSLADMHTVATFHISSFSDFEGGELHSAGLRGTCTRLLVPLCAVVLQWLIQPTLQPLAQLLHSRKRGSWVRRSVVDRPTQLLPRCNNYSYLSWNFSPPRRRGFSWLRLPVVLLRRRRRRRW